MSVTTERGRTHYAGRRDRLADKLAAVKVWVAAALLNARFEMHRQVAGISEKGLRGWFQSELDDAHRATDYSDNRLVRAGQLGDNLVNVMLVIVIAGVIGYVGIKVTSETEDSIEVGDNTAFDNASSSLTGGLETSFGLVEVVFIVLMLAIIVGALVVLRGRRGNGM